MITTLRQNSLKLCQRFSPVREAIFRKNSLIGGIRYASLTSNIARAARKSAFVETARERYGRPSRYDKDKSASSFRRESAFPSNKRYDRPSSSYDDDNHGFSGRNERYNDGRSEPGTPWSKRGQSSNSKMNSGKGSGNIKRRRGKQHTPSDEVPERVKTNVTVPRSIPYTTPASEFIYGLSPVQAALRCTRRKLYVLYIYQAADEVLTPEKIALRKLALARGIQVKMAFGGWDRLLDKMSTGRPHNGCVLEASPMPQLPVTCLEPVSSPTDTYFVVGLAKQSVEEATVNGSSSRIVRVERFEELEKSRFPLVLLLDGVLDPGNMGAVIRSAYYLGVDALVLTGRNSAPMSPVTIKASAGAAENMTILKANNDNDFIRRSRENGWRFYAADSPENVADLISTHGTLVDDSSATTSSTTSLLNSAPTVLMFGSEGTGLLPRIKSQADGFVSIPGARIRPHLGINDTARVDSLNVSVAAAMLIEMLMRVPLQVAKTSSPSTTVQEDTTLESSSRSFDFN